MDYAELNKFLKKYGVDLDGPDWAMRFAGQKLPAGDQLLDYALHIELKPGDAAKRMIWFSLWPGVGDVGLLERINVCVVFLNGPVIERFHVHREILEHICPEMDSGYHLDDEGHVLVDSPLAAVDFAASIIENLAAGYPRIRRNQEQSI